jgi:hypothetical protein
MVNESEDRYERMVQTARRVDREQQPEVPMPRAANSVDPFIDERTGPEPLEPDSSEEPRAERLLLTLHRAIVSGDSLPSRTPTEHS